MSDRKVAIRLGTEGKAEVKNDLKEIGDSGRLSFDGIGQAGEAAAKRAQQAFDRAAADIVAAQQRQANAAAKLATIEPKSALVMGIEARASAGARNGSRSAGGASGDWEGSAKRSAGAFNELIAVEARMEAKARAILATLDPLAAAQDRYNKELAETRALQTAGLLTADQATARQRQLKEALDQTTRALDREAAALGRAGVASGNKRAVVQQLGFQTQDFAVQVAGGTSALTAFAQQAPQAFGALSMLSQGADGAEKATGLFGRTAGGVLRLLGGPWGVGFITAGTVALALASKSDNLGESLDRMSSKADSASSIIRSSFAGLGNVFDPLIDGANVAIVKLQQLTGLTVASQDTVAKRFQDQVGGLLGRVDEYANLGDGIEQFFGGIGNRSDLRGRYLEGIKRDQAAQGRTRARIEAEKQDRLFQSRFGFSGGSAVLGTLSDYQDANRKSDRDADRAGEKAARDAKREAAKAARDGARETAKTAGDLQSALQGLEEQFDPTASAARKYAEVLGDIDKLQKSDKLSADKAASYRFRAGMAQYDQERQRIEEALATAGQKTLNDGRTLEQYWDGMGELIDGDALERSLSGLDKLTVKAQLFTTELIDMKAVGTDALQSILDVRRFEDFGKVGSLVLDTLRRKFLELALVNPLTNLLNPGQKALPTLFSLFKAPTGNAAGTEYFGGGLSWIAENGPELVSLPRGSKVTPAAQTRRMMDAANDRGATTKIYDLRGAVVYEDLMRKLEQSADGAAARGAIGGSAMTEMRLRRRAKYRLPA